jgi:hypothetical protein
MAIKFNGVDAGRSDVVAFPPHELDNIILALNLRQDLGDLTDLKKSIAEHGQLQPDAMRVHPSRISQLLGLLELPAKVRTLVHHGTATEALARQLRGLDEEKIATFTERLETGAKPDRRAGGESRARTLSELRQELKRLGSSRATDLLQWIAGDPTVGTLDEVLR